MAGSRRETRQMPMRAERLQMKRMTPRTAKGTDMGM